MSTPLLTTKLYIPRPRTKVVLRPRLLERLHAGLYDEHGFERKLTLISAAAGFGKTTLVSSWLDELRAEFGAAQSPVKPAAQPAKLAIAWLSLDEGDNDPDRFLLYLVAALQTVAAKLGEGVVRALQSPQPPREAAGREALLTSLLNEIATTPHPLILVLDDYHVIEAAAVDQALTFLLDHLPPQLHLVIATREDPQLPLARLRARGLLTEIRAADLRFTASEAAAFLKQVMGLNLATSEIAALENRTEGWIAGLQLAALSMQGQPDSGNFIQTFTGSHRFVLDYLVTEVLNQQPASIQYFLLRTSILNRMCGPLCEAVIGDWQAEIGRFDDLQSPFAHPHLQSVLEYLEQANLFIIPLDNERRWYRYHHLFGELLRQRLPLSLAASAQAATDGVNALHLRASQWYEEQGLVLEAFHHATAANDVARAERLIEGDGIQLHLRGAVLAILQWLESLPLAVLQARPWLWWRHAALLLVNGQTSRVEEKLQAAEAALQSSEWDERLGDKTRNLVGRIATARAVLALTRYQVEPMLVQSRRALEYLDPDNLTARANANWTLGFAHFLRGDQAASRQAYTTSIALSQGNGDSFTTILATIGLGQVQEVENQLHLAAQTYRHVLQLAGDQPLQIINETHLGLARILYEWNDLAGATEHAQQSLHLARQYERVIDRFIVSEVLLARLQLAQGDVSGAAARLTAAEQAARQQNFVLRLPEVAATQVLICLRQGNRPAAAQLAERYDLPLSRAHVHLAQGDPIAALRALAPLQQRSAATGRADERLKVLVLQALAHQAQGDMAQAFQGLDEVLALTEPEGFIRTFVDEGAPMLRLLSSAAPTRGSRSDYMATLLAAFAAEPPASPIRVEPPPARTTQPLIEPLSERELEVLQLIAQGLSNQEICARLFLALSTVKGHNQRIFAKLQVQRRTEAIARARKLGLI